MYRPFHLYHNIKPKSVIRPKQGNYQDIIASLG